MKTLNLDAFAKITRTLTLGGEVYPVEEMTVENFIETTRQADELAAKKEDATFGDQINATISMITRSIPSCPAEKLRRLTIEQLVVISKYLRGELDGEESAEGQAEEGAEKK